MTETEHEARFLERAINPFRTSLIPLETGVALNIIHWPARQAAARPAVLVHGFDNNARIWDPLAATLSAYRDVYAVDLRGHGDSDWTPPETYCHEQHVADLESLSDKLGLDESIYIGHSLGGRLGLYLALRRPERLAAIVTADMGPDVGKAGAQKMKADKRTQPSWYPSKTDYFAYLKDIYVLATEDRIRHLVDHGIFSQRGGFATKTDPAYIRRFWQEPPPADCKMVLPRGNALWESLALIRQPVGIIRGLLSSILTAESARRMVELLPNARLRTIEGAGHALMVDRPDETADVIRRFIEEVEMSSVAVRNGEDRD